MSFYSTALRELRDSVVYFEDRAPVWMAEIHSAQRVEGLGQSGDEHY